MFKRLNFTEPAVLRGVITAVLALAASFGLVSSTDVQGVAEVLIPLAAVLLPLLQSVWTRGAVFAPKSVGVLRNEGPDGYGTS